MSIAGGEAGIDEVADGDLVERHCSIASCCGFALCVFSMSHGYWSLAVTKFFEVKTVKKRSTILQTHQKKKKCLFTCLCNYLYIMKKFIRDKNFLVLARNLKVWF